MMAFHRCTNLHHKGVYNHFLFPEQGTASIIYIKTHERGVLIYQSRNTMKCIMLNGYFALGENPIRAYVREKEYSYYAFRDSRI